MDRVELAKVLYESDTFKGFTWGRFPTHSHYLAMADAALTALQQLHYQPVPAVGSAAINPEFARENPNWRQTRAPKKEWHETMTGPFAEEVKRRLGHPDEWINPPIEDREVFYETAICCLQSNLEKAMRIIHTYDEQSGAFQATVERLSNPMESGSGISQGELDEMQARLDAAKTEVWDEDRCQQCISKSLADMPRLIAALRARDGGGK